MPLAVHLDLLESREMERHCYTFDIYTLKLTHMRDKCSYPKLIISLSARLVSDCALA